jgi:YVTN family beta-propeller protein
MERRRIWMGILAAVASLAYAAPAGAEGFAAEPGTTEVMYAGSNWDGTVDIIDAHTYARLGRINVVPDLMERKLEINSDPVSAGYLILIRELIGEGHDQLVDDMFSSHDGRFLYASRPSLKDVVGFDLKTQKIVWRVPVEGFRADHMAISPDGSQLLVSASTANKVQVIDPRVGKLVGEFPSGDQPHESNFSRDGKTIFHASIGTVYTPTDQPALDATKGKRVFEVVDAKTLKVTKQIDIGKLLADQGHPGFSSAIRPMAIAPDERHFYFQLSFFHGFIEFDNATDKVLRIANLPDLTNGLPREGYLLDSAMHGIAMNGAGTKLCVAGTMSDYAAIVSRATFAYKMFQIGHKPYWSTTGGDGTKCWLSFSGDDTVAVIDYDSEQVASMIPVGDHPQRVRVGAIRDEYIGKLPSPPARAPKLSRRCTASKRLSVRLADPDASVARVQFKIGRARLGTVDRTRPFGRTASRATLARARGAITATVVFGDGRRKTLRISLARCGVRRA